VPPTETLRAAAAGWGLAVVDSEPSDPTVRKLVTHWRNTPTLPLAVAINYGDRGRQETNRAERWMNYCGPSPALDRVTMGEVLGLGGQRMAPGALRGKVVFVGFDAAVTPATGVRDTFATPFGRFTPGVEILANAYANLANRDSLRQLSLPVQAAFALVFGAVSLIGLLAAGGRWQWVAAAVLGLGVLAVAAILHHSLHYWWNWLALAAVQLPLTLLLVFFLPTAAGCGIHQLPAPGGRFVCDSAARRVACARQGCVDRCQRGSEWTVPGDDLPHD
jgi:hypothetical protein